MKKIASLLLLLTFLISFVSCDKKTNYKPVESTEEEAKTVMTLTFDGKTYDVRYELFRALFLNYKSEIDGGNSAVWTGPDKDEYIKQINTLILDKVTEIYSAFAICQKIGFDIYSKDVEKQINEFIDGSIKGGSFNGVNVSGCGSYEKYLENLKEMNLNYSTQILLYRYSIAIDAINEHYIGTVTPEDIKNGIIDKGAIEYTKEDVKKFYDSDACVRVLRTYIQSDIAYNPEERIEKIRNIIVEAAKSNDEERVAIAMIGSGSLIAESEVKNGYIIGRHSLDKAFFKEMTDVAFALEIGEVSKAVKVNNGTETIYYIMYRAEKSDKHFEECYDSIEYAYLNDCVGGILDTVENVMKTTAKNTDFLKTINYSEISMN